MDRGNVRLVQRFSKDFYDAVGVSGNIWLRQGVRHWFESNTASFSISKGAEVQGDWQRRAYIPHESRRCNAAGFKSLNPSDILCWSGDGNV